MSRIKAELWNSDHVNPVSHFHEIEVSGVDLADNAMQVVMHHLIQYRSNDDILISCTLGKVVIQYTKDTYDQCEVMLRGKPTQSTDRLGVGSPILASFTVKLQLL